MRLLSISEVQGMQLELMKKLHVFLQAHSIEYYLIAGSALGAVRHGGFIPWDDDIDIGMFRSEYERFLEIADRFDGEYEVVNYKHFFNCDFGLTRIYFPNTYIDNPAIEKTRLDKRLYFDIFPLDNVPDDIEERRRFEIKIKKKKATLEKIDVRDYHNGTVRLWVKKAYSLFLRPFRRLILSSFDKLMRKYEQTTTTCVCSLCSQYAFDKQVMNKAIYGVPTLREFSGVNFYVPEQTDVYLNTLYGNNYMEIPPVEKRRKGHNIYEMNEEQ